MRDVYLLLNQRTELINDLDESSWLVVSGIIDLLFCIDAHFRAHINSCHSPQSRCLRFQIYLRLKYLARLLHFVEADVYN